MSAKRKPKPLPEPTLAQYHGMSARVCGLLNISPAPKGDESLSRLRFEAIGEWCKEKQESNRKIEEAFGE